MLLHGLQDGLWYLSAVTMANTTALMHAARTLAENASALLTGSLTRFSTARHAAAHVWASDMMLVRTEAVACNAMMSYYCTAPHTGGLQTSSAPAAHRISWLTDCSAKRQGVSRSICAYQCAVKPSAVFARKMQPHFSTLALVME